MADEKHPSPPDTRERLPPRQVLTRKWPVLTFGDTPRIDLKEWRFRLFGILPAEKVLSWEELNSLPRTETVSDMHCVTRWSRYDNRWGGVPARELVRLADPPPSARFVLVHAYGDYTTNLPLEALLGEGAIFATHHDGNPLPAEHGGPLRLVVPRLYLWKSAKWANGLEFLETEKPGFWERNGYHMRGDPWKEERHSGW